MPKTINGSGSGVPSTTGTTSRSVASPATSSGIRRLDPVDGLFLRAEHLQQIQDYAADLSRLDALAGGSGVVYGFTLDLDPEKQTVGATAGLAFDPSGGALRSRSRLEVDLTMLERGGAGQIWIVEVVAAEPIPSGNEPLYSSVCGTPREPESSIQPWRDYAVQLRVRADTLTGNWVNADAAHARSALVSTYFDRERRGGDPWLTPATAGAAIPDLATRTWGRAAPEASPSPAGVALGLLAWIGDAWCLDVWSARRDRVLTPPVSAWQSHFGLRPQPVFTAQVLQFQDQLAAGPVSPGYPLTKRFVELPPAGFLPMPTDLGEDQEGIGRWLDEVFGSGVKVNVNRCTADVALSAVTLAQHLDRIPLVPGTKKGHGTKTLPEVQIFAPLTLADLPQVWTDRYGWLAFVRSPQGLRPDRRYTLVPPHFPGQTDVVRAFVLDAPSSRVRYRNRVESAAAEDPVTEVLFGESGWEMPLDPEAMMSIRRAIDEGGPAGLVDLVATSADLAREPLIAARARALAAQLDLGEAGGLLGVYTTRLDGPDAVFIMVRRQR